MNRINKATIAGRKRKSSSTGFVTDVCIVGFLFLLTSVSGGGQYQIVWSTIDGGKNS